LAPGRRRSINAWTNETVPALPGSLDPNPRPRRQRVSVLDHCSGQISIALPLTDSAKAARPTGIVTAKLGQALFDRLPHSQKLAGACATDGDCNTGYACATTPFGDMQCTPQSLLPVFGLDDPNVSGQLRGFMLMPVLARDDMTQFPVQALLAPPPTPEAFLPGNMATDDAFLNGLAPALGLPVWGETCSTVADCPNSGDYACEADEAGQRRCRDLKALYSLRLEVEASDAVGLVLLGGVVDVGMENLLPILATFLTAGSEDLTFDVGGMLGAFRLRTLHACPLTVAVQAGVENDISAQLASLDLAQCWNVTYQQQEATVPIPDPYAISADNTCQTDTDCGWPAQNERCLPADPAQPDVRHCLIPMYRVQIVSEQEVRLAPAEQAISPTTPGFDARLCGFLPASGRYQKLCPGQDSPPTACDPPQWCDAPTPAGTECALPYGLAVLAADFDPGHAALPKGGRVVLGFLFNVSPFSSQLRPAFLAPALADMQAVGLQAVQMYYRNLWLMPDGRYQVLEGGTSVAASSAADTRQLVLPEHASWPGVSDPPDAGLDTSVTFAPSDPLAACGQTDFDRVYATATGMSTPEAGVHMLPPQLALTNVGAQGLLGLTIQRVDRGQDATGDPVAYPDAQWRLYAPAGLLDVALPPGVNPVPAGEEVWVSPAAIRFAVPFDYDLFPAHLIQREQTRTAKDSYATIVP
jgi:hypothetical protein